MFYALFASQMVPEVELIFENTAAILTGIVCWLKMINNFQLGEKKWWRRRTSINAS